MVESCNIPRFDTYFGEQCKKTQKLKTVFCYELELCNFIPDEQKDNDATSACDSRNTGGLFVAVVMIDSIVSNNSVINRRV